MPETITPVRRQQKSKPDRQRLTLDIKIELAGTVPFRRSSDLRVPDRPGVYIIHDLRGVLYVGRTCSLRRRFQQHEGEPANPLIPTARQHPVGTLSFSWIELDDPKRRQAVEAELIAALDPPCNRCTPNLPH